jgi:hypothetical protein
MVGLPREISSGARSRGVDVALDSIGGRNNRPWSWVHSG